jgi:hypothetical protein
MVTELGDGTHSRIQNADKGTDMPRIAIPYGYHNVALELADWSSLADRATVTVNGEIEMRGLHRRNLGFRCVTSFTSLIGNLRSGPCKA